MVDSHHAETEEDIYQIRQLLDQCIRVSPAAIKEGSLNLEEWRMIGGAIEQVKPKLVPEKMSLIKVSEILEYATSLAET
jgi:hypothetical protein